MKALHIYAGVAARAHITKHGLRPQDVGVIPGAAGGPKGLILGSLDRYIFGQWLPQSSQPVDLVGASIGAWRMATACLDNSVAAFERLERDYISQDYEVEPGRNFPSPKQVSAGFSQSLEAFFGGQVDALLSHPRYKLHIITSRGRHMLKREGRALSKLTTPLGFLGAFAANAVQRKAMGAYLERVVFSAQHAPLPFATTDYRTCQVTLNAHNFQQALQASCSIPFVLEAIHNIPGAPRGAYWDGGLTDYHLHLLYNTHENVANNDHMTVTLGSKTINSAETTPQKSAPLVLYPHFQQSIVPGWLDKSLKWRHRSSAALDHMVVLAPNPEWIKTLPHSKLPDRQDFKFHGTDLKARVAHWTKAVGESGRLVEEFDQFLSTSMRASQVLSL
jgi:hypothetical protein